MSQRILQCLVIFGINLVTGGLFAAAFLLYIFKGDLALAAIPAVLAMPAMLLQPWFLLYFFYAPGGAFTAPFLTTAVSVPLYIFLDRRGHFDRVKLAFARFKNRRTFLVVSSLLFCIFAVGFARIVDFPSLDRGIPESVALQQTVKNTQLNLTDPRYYCLGSFIDSEWLWQATLPEQDLDVLADKLGLQPIPADQIGAAYEWMPPYWWRPVVNDRVRVLATTDFPISGRGPDGWHALATWNPDDQVLHMWIKDNF